jgi:hypothetical protein
VRRAVSFNINAFRNSKPSSVVDKTLPAKLHNVVSPNSFIDYCLLCDNLYSGNGKIAVSKVMLPFYQAAPSASQNIRCTV